MRGAKGWPIAVAAFVVGLAIVIGTVITAQTIDYVKTFNTSLLTITGSAQQAITSDEVKWVGNFTVTTDLTDIKAGYAQLASDKSLVASYLTQSGVSSSEITFSPVTMNLNYVDCKANPKGCGPFGPSVYKLSQTVRVESRHVQLVTNLAQGTQKLIQEGVLFSSQGIYYYYTKLASLRSKLLAEATKDAKDRAEKITTAVGGGVGQLVSLRTEPFEVTPVDSTEVSNAGLYDTTTIKKKVTAIVVATFRLP